MKLINDSETFPQTYKVEIRNETCINIEGKSNSPCIDIEEFFNFRE